MKLRDFTFLTDENIQPAVLKYLRNMGLDVLDVKENGLRGTSDSELLRLAFTENRIIITHDSDFGNLAFRESVPLKGIIYLRPGHFDSDVTISSLRALDSADPDLSIPFILVVDNQGTSVKIRLRKL